MAEEKVNHPSHYNQSKIECIEAIDAAIENLKGKEAFYTGNVIKYMWRWKDKNGTEDLQKAKWYLNRLIDKIENNEKNNLTDTLINY